VNNKKDVISCGAGPAGLSTAIFCARKGMNVLVLEKESITGAFPRGETMRPDSVIDELLGKDFMDRVSSYRTAERRYHSPSSLRNFSLKREEESYLFHWKDLTEGLKDEAEKAGAEIKFNSRVKEPIIEKGICIGVRLADGNEFHANTVIASDGHSSSLGALSGVNYSKLNCPIAKRIYHDVDTTYGGMEFFFVSRKSLDYAPDFPPVLAFIFPRGNNIAEVGFMIMNAAMSKKEKTEKMPEKEKILEVFERMSKTYPVFSDRLKGASLQFQGVSIIPMAGMHKMITNIPGLVLSGDAIGMVEASGGCGVVASMKNAKFITEFLYQNGQGWNNDLLKKMNREFKKSTIYKHINGKYRKLIPAMRIAFGKLGTEKRINRFWAIMGKFYSNA